MPRGCAIRSFGKRDSSSAPAWMKPAARASSDRAYRDPACSGLSAELTPSSPCVAAASTGGSRTTGSGIGRPDLTFTSHTRGQGDIVEPGTDRPGGLSYSYFTETVTPCWLGLPPRVTMMGWSPAAILVGTTTFNCMTPDTNPGASPAKVHWAGWPPIMTEGCSRSEEHT